MGKKKSQEISEEILKESNWATHKLCNTYVTEAYEQLGYEKRAERMRGCCQWIKFKVKEDMIKLHAAKFCHVRLCAVCQWRRSKKAFKQMVRILAKAKEKHNSRFIFLTLTVRNCDGSALAGTLDDLMEGFHRLFKYKDVKGAVKGFYRGTEITHDTNEFITRRMYYGVKKDGKTVGGRKKYYDGLGLKPGDRNPNYDKYHPHFHCVLAVNPSYFTDKTYISQAKWIELWQRAMKLNYAPSVDVRRCYTEGDGGEGSEAEQITTMINAIAEACKYAVKPGDVVCDDWELTVETVRLLDGVLEKRRFIGLGGIFLEIQKDLKLDDIEDGDLTLKENENDEDGWEIVTYFWNGYNQYVKE